MCVLRTTIGKSSIVLVCRSRASPGERRRPTGQERSRRAEDVLLERCTQLREGRARLRNGNPAPGAGLGDQVERAPEEPLGLPPGHPPLVLTVDHLPDGTPEGRAITEAVRNRRPADRCSGWISACRPRSRARSGVCTRRFSPGRPHTALVRTRGLGGRLPYAVAHTHALASKSHSRSLGVLPGAPAGCIGNPDNGHAASNFRRGASSSRRHTRRRRATWLRRLISPSRNGRRSRRE